MADAGAVEHQAGVRVQRFVLADDVVVEVARMAEFVVLAPVFVEALDVGTRVQDVGDEFPEGDVVAVDERLGLGFRPVSPNDLSAELLLEVDGISLAEFVLVGREEAFERMADEHEFEVGTDALKDFRFGILVERLEPGAQMRVGRLNV